MNMKLSKNIFGGGYMKIHRNKILTYFGISVLGILVLIWSINNDLKFFSFTEDYNDKYIFFYVVMKSLTLLVLSMTGRWIYRLCKNYTKYKKWILYSTIIFFIYFILLIFIWPGNWGIIGDEFQTYLSIKSLRVWPDQGIMSSLFMIIALLIYPAPWMICLLQIVVSALLVGDILCKFYMEFNNKLCSVFVGGLFVSFPALCFALCPIRAWLYSVLVISLLENIFLCAKNDVGDKHIWVCTVICAFVINTRSEGLIFLIIYPIFLFLFKRGISLKRIFTHLIFLILTILVAKFFIWLGNGETLEQHSVLTLVCPLSILVSDDEVYSSISEKDKRNIDAVFDVEVLRENPSYDIPFNGKCSERSFGQSTPEEIKNFKKSAIKILLMKPSVFFQCKWEALKGSIGLWPYHRTIWNIWDDETIIMWNAQSDIHGDLTQEFVHSNDLMENVRVEISRRLVTNRIFGIDTFYIFYAFWIPILLIPFVLVLNIKKNKWEEVFIGIAIIIQFIMVVLMASGKYQMYYLAFYFVGWYMLLRVLANVNGGEVRDILDKKNN